MGQIQQGGVVSETNQVEPTREKVLEREVANLMSQEINSSYALKAAGIGVGVATTAEGIRILTQQLTAAQARILELESQCGVMVEALKFAAIAFRDDGRPRAALDMDAAISTDGNTLVERVKGLEEVIQKMELVLRDAGMFIETFYIDWDRITPNSPDYDKDYKPEFPEIVQLISDVRKLATPTPKASR